VAASPPPTRVATTVATRPVRTDVVHPMSFSPVSPGHDPG
jgi:hypothetical protein